MTGLSIALLVLFWDFPRAFVPAPDQFVVTYLTDSMTAPAEMTTPLSAEGACGGEEPDTFCTTWPDCPKVDTVIFFQIEAQWGDKRVGNEEERLACRIRPGCTCELLQLTAKEGESWDYDPTATTPPQDHPALRGLPTPQPPPPLPGFTPQTPPNPT